MAKAKFDRSKEHVNIGTIGHTDSRYYKPPGKERYGGSESLRPDRRRTGREAARYYNQHSSR